jgi:hypothetical protein
VNEHRQLEISRRKCLGDVLEVLADCFPGGQVRGVGGLGRDEAALLSQCEWCTVLSCGKPIALSPRSVTPAK